MSENRLILIWVLILLFLFSLLFIGPGILHLMINISYNMGNSDAEYSIRTSGLSGVPAETPVTLLFPVPQIGGKPVFPDELWTASFRGWASTGVVTEHGKMISFTSTASPLQEIDAVFGKYDYSMFALPGNDYTSLTFSPQIQADVVQPEMVIRDPDFGGVWKPRNDTAPALIVLPDLKDTRKNITVSLWYSVMKPQTLTGKPDIVSMYQTRAIIEIPSGNVSGPAVVPVLAKQTYFSPGI